MSLNVIFRVLCGISLFSSYSYAQDYRVFSDLPIITYNVNFSDTSGATYQQIKTDIADGLDVLGENWNITQVDLSTESSEFKGVKFTLPFDSVSASQFLLRFMNEGLTIKTFIVYPNNVHLIDGTGTMHSLSKTMSLCGIRHKIDPCTKINCVVINGRPLCGSSEGGTDSSVSSEKEIDSETGRFIVLGYGAAFIGFFFVFIVIYCYKKGCANRRKQIKTEEEDAEKKRADSNEPIIPNHIYNKSRRF